MELDPHLRAQALAENNFEGIDCKVNLYSTSELPLPEGKVCVKGSERMYGLTKSLISYLEKVLTQDFFLLLNLESTSGFEDLNIHLFILH